MAIARQGFQRLLSRIKPASILLSKTINVCLFSTAIWLISKPAYAQVSLYPLVLEETTERGRANTFINVSNSSDQPFRARITAEPFTYTQEQGFQTLPLNSEGDLTPYLFFSPNELVVPANSERRIRMIAQFPPSAPEGEYRAVILTEPLQARTPEDNHLQVNIITRVAATLYVRNGDLSPEIAVESANWDRETQQVQMVVNNTGEASLRPTANWTLRQADTIVATGQSAPTAIMPNDKRNFLLTYSEQTAAPIAPGTYELSGEFVWGDNQDPQAQAFEVEVYIPGNN
ncbi:MAG: P pilus assembly protein, chaperone PapD [Cyanobacteria bacterium J06649_4]